MLPEVAAKRDAVSFLESDSVREAVAKVLPKHITPERIVRVATTSVMGNERILTAIKSPAGKASLMNALMRCSQAGLEPDGRNAHLVPFWSGKLKCYLVQAIFDYKGLITLARRNGIIAKGILVHAKDNFEYIEDDGEGRTVVRHSFDPFEDRGEVMGAYSRAVGKGGADYEFMTIEEIFAIRERSQSRDKEGNIVGPWKTDTGEMIKKTPVRRHSKRWDLAPEQLDALAQDEDTPGDFLKSATVTAAPPSRPLFGKDKVKDAEPTPELTEGAGTDEAGAEPPPPAAELEPPQGTGAKGGEKPVTNYVKAVRGLCRGHVAEGALLGKLTELGVSDGSSGTLEELQMAQPAALVWVYEHWKELAEKFEQEKKS